MPVSAIDPENRRSIKLAERLGFRREGGLLTDYWYVGDAYRNALLYAFVARPNGEAAPAGTAPFKEQRRSRKAGSRREDV
jgi:hypothetical protein